MHSQLPKAQQSIVLVGVGAVGSTVAAYLMAAGRKRVLLVDPQRLEARNRATSPLLRDACSRFVADTCLPLKVDLVVREAHRRGLNQWEALPCEVADVGWQVLDGCDVVCCCTDSVLSRVEAAYTARMLGKPMIEAGVASDGEPACRAGWFPPAAGAACYLCGLREARRAEVLAYAASASLGCAPLAEAPAMTGAAAAVEHAAAGVVRLLEALDAGVLPGDRALVLRSRSVAAGGGAAVLNDEEIAPARSESCPWHEWPDARRVELPWDVPLGATPAGDGDAVLQLAWPLCVAARCRGCGQQSRPLRRVAWVRRAAVCTRCGAQGSLEPLHTVDTLRPGDALRALTPEQLGQPQRHLYLLRPPVFSSQGMPLNGEWETR